MAGKHMESRKRIKLSTVLVIAAALALVTAIGGTMAWLTTHSEGLTNTFTPATISGEVKETFNNPFNTKNNVYIQNTSDVPVYVRVALVPTWTKAETVENVTKYVPVAEPVTGTDVSIDGVNWDKFKPTDSDWVQGNDGYYYYTKPLAAKDSDGSTTPNLFNVANAVPKDGYHMNLQVLLQMIQAEGVNAEGKRPVELAWGITVNADGTISK